MSNNMTLSNSIISRIWQNENLRTIFLSHLDIHSLCQLRLTTSLYCEAISRLLFAHTKVLFTASFLTRPSRLEALSRIGHLIAHFDFAFIHSESSVLPPLLHQVTGHELRFLYKPPTSAAPLSRVKYGSDRLRQLLTLHYPPLFHAGINVPAFIRVMSMMPNLQHLTISCQGQDPTERYRRDAVDYALISLRIAVEKACLPHLEKLTLNNLHPAGIYYLRYMFSYGCTPGGSRCWRQIKRLEIVMSSWDSSDFSAGRENLLILDDYLRSFSANLEELSFRWLGHEGPCPFSAISDPIFTPQKTPKLFGEVTSSMSPLPPVPQRQPMFFPKLRFFKLCNAKISADQVKRFVLAHSATVCEFDFINVNLSDGDHWEDVLAPLKQTSQLEKWEFQRSRITNKSTYCSMDQLKPPKLSKGIDEVVDSGHLIVTNATDSIALKMTQESVAAKNIPRRQKRKRKHERIRKKEGLHSDKCKILESSNDGSNLGIPHSIHLNTFVSGVQRNHRMDAFQQDLADDPVKRASILKRARLAVLVQLYKKIGWNLDRLNKEGNFQSQSCKESLTYRGKSQVFDRRSILVPLVLSC